MPRTEKSERDSIAMGAVSPEAIGGGFPLLDLPIQPPFPPMDARAVPELPPGGGWQYEPKWDGFRCLAFRSRQAVALQSKSGQPLGRYFPEVVAAVERLPMERFVLDGEIVIVRDGELCFDDLLMRIHPAASRMRRLSQETPASLLCFDLLAAGAGKTANAASLVDLPLHERRRRLEAFFARQQMPASIGPAAGIYLSPATAEHSLAQRWMRELAGSGFDGVVAKQMDAPYASGERSMRKIKRLRTADCVVGGFRWAAKGGEVGSLLLGLVDDEGRLHHVGFTSSFSREERRELKQVLRPWMNGSGFSGRAPGGPSRWSTERSGEWEPLKPKLVCEVQYDHFSGGRFRHGTRWLRWRPDKSPRQCSFEQVDSPGASLNDILKAA